MDLEETLNAGSGSLVLAAKWHSEDSAQQCSSPCCEGLIDNLAVTVVAVGVRELMQHVKVLSVCPSGPMSRGFALCPSQENRR